jgi:uncharacterized membrane protein
MEPWKGPPAGALGNPAGASSPEDLGSIPAPIPQRKSPLGIKERIAIGFRWFGFDPPDRWLALLALFVVIDIVVLAWVQILAYNSFYTFSQDFGSFNQTFYTTAHDNLLLYYTSNLPAGSNGTFMAIHFAPLIFLILPFYAVVSGPATLLVMKVTVLGVAAFPAYGIAHRRLGSPQWGLLMATAWLLSPITMGLDWADFDLEVFLPLFILCAIYFLLQRRYFAFFIAWFLAMATIESAVPFLLIFAVVALLGTFWWSRSVTREARDRRRLVLVVSIVLAVLWLVVAFYTLRYYSDLGGTFGSSYASHYKTLQADSFLDVLPQAILHPNLAGAALHYQGSQKLTYLLMLFGCFAFLPLFGELEFLLPVIGWLGLSLLSNFYEEYAFGTQYLGYVSPFLFAGAVGGIVFLRPRIAAFLGAPANTARRVPLAPARRLKWRLPRSDEAILPGVVILAVGITVAIGNPFLDHPVGAVSSTQFGFPTATAHTRLLDRILELIPANASVLTTTHVFPQLSNRPNAYVLPTAELFAGNRTYPWWLDDFINASEYVLLDFTLDEYVSAIMQSIGNYSGFGIEAAGSGIFLLARGWTGLPMAGYATPSSTTFAPVQWSPVPKPPPGWVASPGDNGSFVYTVPSKATGQLVWNGPGLPRIIPGEYYLNVSYKLNAITSVPVMKVRATEAQVQVIPQVNLSTSAGVHYNYNFTRVGAPINLTQQEIGVTSSEKGKVTFGTVSLMFDVSRLSTLTSIASTLVGSFWVLVLSCSLTWVGPPPAFDGLT